MTSTKAYRWRCVDCGIDVSGGERYMLHDDVWCSSGMHPDGGELCIGCVEKRLQRRLTYRDFTDCPLNRGAFDDIQIPQTTRLLSRLQQPDDTLDSAQLCLPFA
jgi:hypothetical protein